MSDSFYIQWHILDRCNLRCRHCYQSEFSKEREPGWPELKRAADNVLGAMAAWRVKLDVALTGGEPFLKPELMPLLHYLNDSPHVGSLCVITNGTIFPEYADELAALSRVGEIRISLDGISEETNDGIRGKGSTAKVLANISRWQELGVPVTVMFTVMRRNVHEVSRFVALGKALGIKAMIIERFFPLGQGEAIGEDALNGTEFLNVWQEVLDQVDVEVEPEELIAYRAIRIDWKDSDVDVFGSGCVVGKDGMAILPDGTVLPCRRFPLSIGNIMETPLTDIWRDSVVLNALRDKANLKGKCRDCAIEECWGCRAMCYCLEGDYLAGDPHCWVHRD
ncbi:MAG: radical SAM protein [Candidatus Omnitrophota bacterium]